MITTDINTFAKEIHALNERKGWWEEKRTFNECLILTKSEMFEAFEAERKGLYADSTMVVNMYSRLMKYNQFNKKDFKLYIKDRFQDEIADVVIRLLDLCAYFNILLTPGDVPHFDLNKTKINYMTFDKATASMYDNPSAKNMQWILGFMKSLAHLYNFDLDMHVALKLEYNKTRPYKHGKKF